MLLENMVFGKRLGVNGSKKLVLFKGSLQHILELFIKRRLQQVEMTTKKDLWCFFDPYTINLKLNNIEYDAFQITTNLCLVMKKLKQELDIPWQSVLLLHTCDILYLNLK